ncbi:Lrp/AsnC family transcriptional regulator [Citromicrobium bathyomarinum]|uniref:Lrp/AsnC family transcriptional regulator n=1 Tax=Citromicrobium bathyomarinum TaxID=72174 RepID=UPI00315A0E88
MTLDSYDLRLLDAIQRDASLTNAKLAEHVHLSASQCARRLDRLRSDGHIERTVAILSRERLGLAILAHIMVGLREHTRDQNDAFQRWVRDTPQVLECFMQSGEVDLILKVAVSDLGELADLIDRLIAITGGVTALKSSIVLREIKSGPELPIRGARRET